MNSDAQRIAIAEACDYSVKDSHVRGGKNLMRAGRVVTSQWFNDACPATLELMRPWLPDYLNDLNAMHEAEKVFTKEQHQAFRNELAGICGFNYNRVENSDPNHHRNYVSATAAQRAEAFLKTLNLWKE